MKEEKETHDVIKEFLEPKKDPYRPIKKDIFAGNNQSPSTAHALKKDDYGNLIERKVIGNNELYEDALKIRQKNRALA